MESINEDIGQLVELTTVLEGLHGRWQELIHEDDRRVIGLEREKLMASKHTFERCADELAKLEETMVKPIATARLTFSQSVTDIIAKVNKLKYSGVGCSENNIACEKASVIKFSNVLRLWLEELDRPLAKRQLPVYEEHIRTSVKQFIDAQLSKLTKHINHGEALLSRRTPPRYKHDLDLRRVKADELKRRAEERMETITRTLDAAIHLNNYPKVYGIYSNIIGLKVSMR